MGCMAFVCRFSNNNHDIQCQSSVGYIDNKYSVGFSNMQIDIRCGVQACRYFWLEHYT